MCVCVCVCVLQVIFRLLLHVIHAITDFQISKDGVKSRKL
mgnify:CR=1 FL=1